MKYLGNYLMAFKQVRLGDYFNFEKGLGYKGEFLAEDSDVALIGMDSHEEGGGYKENSEKFYAGPYKPEHVAEVGDVIFAGTEQGFGLLASPLMVPESDKFTTYLFSGDVLKAIPLKPDEFSIEYLYNLYRVDIFRTKAAYGDSGTTVRRISNENLGEQLVPLPDLPTQVAINEIISLLDQKLSINNSLGENLVSLVRSIFRTMFVDFDIEIKNSGFSKTELEQLEKFYSGNFVKSAIGRIPSGWGVRTIGDSVIKQKPGKLYDTKSSSISGAIPVLDQGRSGFVGFHNDQPGVLASHANPKVVFANHTCSLRLVSYPFSVIQNVFPLDGNDIDTIWLYFAIEGKQKFDTYKGHWPDFILHEIIYPPLELTKLFRNMIFPLMDQKWTLDEESVTLSKIRDSILPKLVLGQLSIPPELRA
jgi:type I restriction enzyme S subunit